jgi:hypothetical protein
MPPASLRAGSICAHAAGRARLQSGDRTRMVESVPDCQQNEGRDFVGFFNKSCFNPHFSGNLRRNRSMNPKTT